MSAESAEDERWRDDLPDRWEDVRVYPPIPAERSLEDDEDLELVELDDGGVIQTPGGFVYTMSDDWLVDLEDVA